MSNNLSAKLLGEIYAQESGDPLLMLLTISHPSFDTIYLVDNTENIISRGQEFIGFPMTLTLPMDDGETERQVAIEFDNVSLELIEELRTVTTTMDVKVEMILASEPDVVQMDYQDLKMRTASYDSKRVRAKLYMDSFLNTAMTSEKYSPALYPGLF